MPSKKAKRAARGPIPPTKATKQTTAAIKRLAGSQGSHQKLKKHPVVAETGWCISCFRVALREWNEAAWKQPLKVNCVWDAVMSKLCQRCCPVRSKCQMAAAVAVLDLCAAFDSVVKSHAETHALNARKLGLDKSAYIQYCATERSLMQKPAPLGARPDGTLHPKSAQFAHRALENLRLDPNSDVSLPWYLSVLSFRQTILDMIKDEFDHCEPAIATWYASMLETFPVPTPGLTTSTS
ncbi:hypothetical protein PENVUL_c008G05928 [Penicillium vulpinum]|uniref:Uncharacterized protein n=1 Tax=Penicillium vulpinum TaxID=29845 RepID=A0A1V6S4Y7_9EURO|nr:hypothetical protein PENVUL_c008G05928 [Penicillium vulpinum]